MSGFGNMAIYSNMKEMPVMSEFDLKIGDRFIAPDVILDHKRIKFTVDYITDHLIIGSYICKRSKQKFVRSFKKTEYQLGHIKKVEV